MSHTISFSSRARWAALAAIVVAVAAVAASPAKAYHVTTSAYVAGQTAGYVSFSRTSGIYDMAPYSSTYFTELNSGSATACATRSFSGNQTIVVQWTAFKWNGSGWDRVYSNFASVNVGPGGCYTFPGWSFSREGPNNYPVGGFHTVNWQVWWGNAATGALLSYQGNMFDELGDYRTAGTYANMESIKYINGRAAVGVCFCP